MDTRIDLHRFNEQIESIKKHAVDRKPEPGGVLLYGSSTMGNWRANDMCYRQLAPLPVFNTGFGGSTAEEALYYYHELFKPFKPSVVVYYEGANDLMNGYTPGEVLDMTHRLFEWARQDFPGIRFLILPIKLSPGIKHIWEQGEICNGMFADYANAHADTSIVDVSSFLFDKSGEHREEIYVEDMLHHNEFGYQQLADLVRPQIEALYMNRAQEA